jgi:hypothetical protein
VYEAAAHIIKRASIGPRHHCYVCGRGLSDPPSTARGIGSECWQDVLHQIEELRSKQMITQTALAATAEQ